MLWPDEDPIGKRLRRGGMDADANAPWLTVVGVVGAHQAIHARRARFAHRDVSPAHAGRLARDERRLRGDRARRARGGRRGGEFARIDPDLPIYNVKTMTRRVDESLARRRFAMLLLTLFAGIALVLASVGIYGVMAYLVDQGHARPRHPAWRSAPRRAAFWRWWCGTALTRRAVGVAIGLAGAFALATVMRSLLFGVDAGGSGRPSRPVALLLIAVAIAGSYLPARRAAKIDPAVAFRAE